MHSVTVDTSLGHKPDGKWAFDKRVADCFSDMLKRSIPQYDVMRQACFDVGSEFVTEADQGCDVVDLGASRGDALAPFIDKYGATRRYVAVEVSPPMLDVLKGRYSGLIEHGLVRVLDTDLRRSYPHCTAALTLCVLTLQFTPIEYRQRIVRSMFKHTVPGGAVILVEKILGETAEINEQQVGVYHAMKEANGYTQEEIDRKRLSLEGVLIPVTAKWNEELLTNAGFTAVDCFWRWMNFAAWVAVKESD